MRTRFLLPVAVCFSAFAARADLQIDPNAPSPPPPAQTTSSTTTVTTSSSTITTTTASATPDGSTSAAAPEDARTAALAQRFAQGQSVEAQGNLEQARAIFDGIIADAPDAKGSLREAGLISVQLGDYLKADDYFSKLHALVPDYPMAIEMLIQVNQTLKRDAKVEIMLKELRDLYTAGKLDPKRPYFVRERIHLNGGIDIRITEFFDYHQQPDCAWWAEVFDAQHHRKRWLAVNYDPEVTAQMRKDPKLASAEQFLVVDNVMDAQGNVVRIDCYQQFLALPDYAKMRMILLEILANGLKPIDSAPVPQSGQ
jgi:tetratricopeptide (TPR) repeat protein